MDPEYQWRCRVTNIEAIRWGTWRNSTSIGTWNEYSPTGITMYCSCKYSSETSRMIIAFEQNTTEIYMKEKGNSCNFKFILLKELMNITHHNSQTKHFINCIQIHLLYCIVFILLFPWWDIFSWLSFLFIKNTHITISFKINWKAIIEHCSKWFSWEFFVFLYFKYDIILDLILLTKPLLFLLFDSKNPFSKSKNCFTPAVSL